MSCYDLAVTGNTYPIRSQIRQICPLAHWDRRSRCWRVVDATDAQVAALQQLPGLQLLAAETRGHCLRPLTAPAAPAAPAAEGSSPATEGSSPATEAIHLQELLPGIGRGLTPQPTRQPGQALRHHRGILYVEEVSVGQWHSGEWLEDCAGFYGTRGGHIQSVRCRLATEEESAPVLAAEAAKAARRAAAVALGELAKAAVVPTPEQLAAIPAAKGEESANYEWRFGEAAYVLAFNGRDGDDWSLNNWGDYVVRVLPAQRGGEARALLAASRGA